jgi:hypothetical protein
VIRALDVTVENLLKTQAAPGSELAGADISFDIPDGDWRTSLEKLTVNCYLYDIRENRDLRTTEPVRQRDPGTGRSTWRAAPVRIDCAYCITAWSPADDESVLDEHRLLSQVLMVLLRNRTIPPGALAPGLPPQLPPYPTVVASTDGMKNLPEFWGALDQQLKPSLSYVVTLVMLLDPEPADAALAPDIHPDRIGVNVFDRSELP